MLPTAAPLVANAGSPNQPLMKTGVNTIVNAVLAISP